MQLIPLIEAVFNRPPMPFDPQRQSFKAWVMYCLRDRGFKVIYAQNADFAIESRDGSKLYCSVTENSVSPEELTAEGIWIVRDPATNQITVVTSS